MPQSQLVIEIPELPTYSRVFFCLSSNYGLRIAGLVAGNCFPLHVLIDNNHTTGFQMTFPPNISTRHP